MTDAPGIDFELWPSAGPGHIAVATLNVPATLNSLDLAMVDALVGALQEADADGSVRAVILTGAGRAFCSGGDLRQMQPGPDSLIGDSPEATRDNYRQGIQRIPLAMEALGVPVIAAIKIRRCRLPGFWNPQARPSTTACSSASVPSRPCTTAGAAAFLQKRRWTCARLI